MTIQYVPSGRQPVTPYEIHPPHTVETLHFGRPAMESGEQAAASKIAAIQKGKNVRRTRQDEAAAAKLQSVQTNDVRSDASSPVEELSGLDDSQAVTLLSNTRASERQKFSQLGLKSGLPVDPVPGLRFLTFYSWWLESGTKRYVEICFDLQSELFQVRSLAQPPVHLPPLPSRVSPP